MDQLIMWLIVGVIIVIGLCWGSYWIGWWMGRRTGVRWACNRGLEGISEFSRLKKIEAAATAWRRSLEEDNWSKEAIESGFCRPGMGVLLKLIEPR